MLEEASRIMRTHYDEVCVKGLDPIALSGFNRGWHVRSAERSFFLKQCNNIVSPLFFPPANAALAALSEVGLETLLVQSSGGDFLVRDEGCYWSLARYTEARPIQPPAWEHSALLANYLCRLQAVPLGRMARVDVHSGGDQGDRLRPYWMDAARSVDEAIEVVRKSNAPNDLLRQLAEARLRISHSHGNVSSGLRRCISHGEFQTQNVLLDSSVDASLQVVDWDSVGVRPRVWDITSAALYLCRLRRGAFDLNMQELTRFLSVFALKEEELHAMPEMALAIFLPRLDHFELFGRNNPNALTWYVPWSVGAGVHSFKQLSLFLTEEMP